MKAIRLRTEYLKNPIGIDICKPRLSWNCEGGIKQEAYEIQAFNEDGKIIWNSGIVISNKMHLIPYDGPELKSRDKIGFQVRLMENGIWGNWSEKAFFEMGLLEQSDWKAKWITGNYRPDKKALYPVDCFRKIEKLKKSGDIKKARLYASACGVYEFSINGKKAGDFVLAPGYTDYNRRIQYQTIDVTDLVKLSCIENNDNLELSAELASGWYRGSIGAHGLRNQYGIETKLLAQLEINYEDGSSQTIITDESWSWSNDGPILFADNKDGEYIDVNRSPSYSGKVKLTNHSIVPTASNNVPLVEHEIFAGKVSRSPSGRTIVDFGQNLAGYITMKFTAKKGQIVRLRFGELLGKDGELVQSNGQCISKKKITPLQEILYVCKEGENIYKTKFAIFGFQFAEIQTGDFTFDERDYFKEYCADVETNYGKVSKNDISALQKFEISSIAVYSDIEETGYFDCSNPLVNQFVQATKWSTKSNSADIPTDCPTRERHGWTGDAQIFFKTASYLFDYSAFSQKYLRDVYDWQQSDGKLPQIAPYGGVDFYMNTMNGSVGWSDIGILLPYYFYQMNGDKRILEEYYSRMKKYTQFMQSRCGKWGGFYAQRIKLSREAKNYLVNCGQSYDEWAEPQDVKKFHWTDFAAPHPEVQTAYTSYIMHLMCEIAELTNHKEDIAEYKRYEEGCKAAYQELIKQDGFKLDTDRQARLVRPLAFNLLDEETSEYAKQRLIKALENYRWRLGTGFLSTPLILDLLSTYNLNAAYRLLENEEIPGWLSMPKAGATTIWESWEGFNAQGEVASLNHYSKGALCEWLFKGMCGINLSANVVNHFVIKPLAGGNFTFAKAKYNSVFGLVKSGWKKADNKTIFEIEIPSNTTATIILQNGKTEEVLAGKYEFEITGLSE